MYQEEKIAIVRKVLSKLILLNRDLQFSLLPSKKNLMYLIKKKEKSLIVPKIIENTNSYEKLFFHTTRKDIFFPQSNSKNEEIFCLYVNSNIILDCFLKKNFTTFIESFIPKYCHLKRNSSKTILKESNLELVRDDWVPISSTEKIIGGTSNLYFQGMCPLKSYFNNRLKANLVYDRHFKKYHVIEGVIIHHTLNLVWAQIERSETLSNSSFFRIKDLISLATKISLKVSLNNSLNHFYTKSRNVMLNWIINERKRQFFSVISTEKMKFIKTGKISFYFRPDRVDELIDKKNIILDYKYTKQKHIFKNSSLGLQIPIYCLLFNNKKIYDGFCIGLISSKNITMQTISQEKNSSNNNSVFSWKSILYRWKDSIEKLSYEFCQGVISSHKKNPNSTNKMLTFFS